MRLLRTALQDVVLVEPAVMRDARGWFCETYQEPRFHAALAALGLPLPRPFVQDNHSGSKAGVLRGLHYQVAPHAQGKLVRVVRGAAFDVAVDVRRGSPGFGRWFGATLSESNRRQMWVPDGHAHGFLALEEDTQVVYKTTDVHVPRCERAVRWNDPAIGIEWPVLPGVDRLLAPRDAAAPLLAHADAC